MTSTSEQVAQEMTRETRAVVNKAANIAERIVAEVAREARVRNVRAEVSKTTALKNNENKKMGITIRFDGDRAAPTLYMDSAIDRIKRGDSIKDVAKEILDTAIKVRDNGQELAKLDINPETAQQKVFLKVVNKETNSEMLAKCPHIDIGEDLMAVPYWKVKAGNGEVASFLVNREIMTNSLQMTDSELLSIGRANTVESGFEIKGMSETLREMMGDDMPIELIADMTPPGPEMMYVVSNPEKVYGATALLDSQTMENISERIGEDNFYVLPSSIHEILIIPESLAPSPEELSEMVRTVNQKEVSVQDRLSDNAYRYDGNSMKLSICNTMQQLKEQKESAEKIGEVLSNAHRVKM